MKNKNKSGWWDSMDSANKWFLFTGLIFAVPIILLVIISITTPAEEKEKNRQQHQYAESVELENKLFRINQDKARAVLSGDMKTADQLQIDGDKIRKQIEQLRR